MYQTPQSRIIPWLITALSISGVTATSAQAAYQGSAPAARPAAAAPSDSVDRAVVAALTKANRDEVAMARSAQASLQDAEVKRFAQRMIDDHSAGLTAITSIATRLNYPLPSDPAAAGGMGTTDARYLSAQVLGHQQLLGQLPTNVSTIQDPGLRQHVTDTRKTVEMHLADAKRLQDKVGTGRTP